jgi:hypothetical protein
LRLLRPVPLYVAPPIAVESEDRVWIKGEIDVNIARGS